MLVARGNICIVLFFHKNHELSYKAVMKNVLWTFLEGSGTRKHFEYQTKTSYLQQLWVKSSTPLKKIAQYLKIDVIAEKHLNLSFCSQLVGYCWT